MAELSRRRDRIGALVPTRPGQSKTLLDDLLSDRDPVAVEAAIARLAIIGRPALRQVLLRVPATEVRHLPLLLRVLERIGDPAAMPTVRPLLGHAAPDVAGAAVDAMGALLDARDPAVAASALDALTDTLLDTARHALVRLRAFEAISTAGDHSATYDADVVEPLRAQLRRDASPAIRAAMAPVDSTPVEPSPLSGEAQLEAATDDALPADPEQMRHLLAEHGHAAPLTQLHRVIERVRSHESTLRDGRADAWRLIRAAAHLALANRGSRVAVYDLRETLAALGARTPVGMLSALQQVGDASVLEGVADAWTSATDTWFRDQLVIIFRDVVAREGIGRRHAAIKKIAARAPATFAALWP